MEVDTSLPALRVVRVRENLSLTPWLPVPGTRGKWQELPFRRTDAWF